MAALEINIDGRAYPCRQTMGALLLFKERTGKELSEVGTALSGLCEFMYCCVVSSCRHDNVDFGMTLEAFVDSVTVDDLNAWNAAGLAESASEEKTAKGKN